MKKFILLILTIILVGSCSLFIPVDSATGLVEFKTVFMSSYNMLTDSGLITTEQSETPRAVAPVWMAGENTSFTSTGTINDYPEQGQITDWSYTDQGSDIYLVTSFTYYPNDTYLDYTKEVYYVLDDGNGVHGSEDSYVDANGITNSKYRKNFRTFFTDGTRRVEAITEDATGSAGQYALFEIDGSLDYDTVAPVSDTFTAGVDNRWSSKVVYSHNAKDSYFWNWWGTVRRISMNGERYYSAGMVEGEYVQTYLFKEWGTAKKAEWDEEVAPDLPDDRESLFTGVLRIEIIGSIKTIKGQYTINTRSGDVFIVTIDDDDITVTAQ